MDQNLTDLDVILTTVRDTRSRIYLEEAVSSYRAGAFRASITAIWVALNYDLIAKIRELSNLNDGKAKDFIKKWDKARDSNNITEMLSIERSILEISFRDLELYSSVDLILLKRIQEDRNLCSHPAFSSESDLFRPTSELVRVHIVNATSILLSQPPIQGKRILEEFDKEIRSPGYPHDEELIHNYFERRYLSRTRTSAIHNIGIVLGKFLLRGAPEDWLPFSEKIAHSLVGLRNRRPQEWVGIEAEICDQANNSPIENRLNILSILTLFPYLTAKIDNAILISIKSQLSVANIDEIKNPLVLGAIKIPYFHDEILSAVKVFSGDDLAAILQSYISVEFFDIALENFSIASSFRGAEHRFAGFIAPFAGRLSSNQN